MRGALLYELEIKTEATMSGILLPALFTKGRHRTVNILKYFVSACLSGLTARPQLPHKCPAYILSIWNAEQIFARSSTSSGTFSKRIPHPSIQSTTVIVTRRESVYVRTANNLEKKRYPTYSAFVLWMVRAASACTHFSMADTSTKQLISTFSIFARL